MWETHHTYRRNSVYSVRHENTVRARESLALKNSDNGRTVVKPLRQGISPFSSSIDHDVINDRSRSKILR